ncbi:MAG: RagB/SusD family nutrient uptake outer membrane protein [Saprospiraceae bacterium]|nr:RagB/SusD family nutrient uptake outer membrane protein [Saprospiraceae bacterium]
MKKKNQFYLMLVLLLLSVSCENILDKDPIGTLDAGSFFQTEADALQALNAAYKPLTFSNSNNNFYWAFGVLTGDEAIAGGDGSRSGMVEIDALTHTPRTEEINSFWKLQYSGITQCNLVLDKIQEISFNPVVQSRIIGESLFLRSYYYFLLLQVFGDVPLFTSIVSPDKLKIPRTPKSDIFNQIIADCDRAASFLPDKYSVAELGRATKGAALALAAKASLYQKNWDKTLEYIARIKALNVYALMMRYEDNFKELTQNNSESVWEIQHTNLELGVGNSLNQWWTSKKVTGGYGFAEVTGSLFNAFETDDPRRRFTIAMNNEDYFGVVYKNSFSSTRYSPRKYLQTDSTATQKADGDINYTAIRYAEVLLWEAESLAGLGRVNEAGTPLELVRSRARAQASNPVTALPKIVTNDKQTMINAIRHERQVELGFEMHRFFDLVRWGIAAANIPEFITGKHEVFPIPQTEIDLNPKLNQNPGY